MSSKQIAIASTTFVGALALYMYYQQKKKYSVLKTPEELTNASWRLVGKVKSILLYPVKSCGPMQLQSAITAPHGLTSVSSTAKDRNFLLVSKSSGEVVTGRKYPKTVLIRPQVQDDGQSLIIRCNDQEDCVIQKQQWENGEQLEADFYGQKLTGRDCGDEAGLWLSSYLSHDVRLMYCHELQQRQVATDLPGSFPLLIPEKDAPIYGDGMSYMLLSQESVNYLQQHTGMSLTAQRFRPNIVVESCEDGSCEPLQPFAEDKWTYIKIGDGAILRVSTPCSRCVFTCVDPHTGNFDKNLKTLGTLKKLRTLFKGYSPCFGVNLGLEQAGTIAVAQPVYALI